MFMAQFSENYSKAIQCFNAGNFGWQMRILYLVSWYEYDSVQTLHCQYVLSLGLLLLLGMLWSCGYIYD